MMASFRVVGLDPSLTSTGISDGLTVHVVQTSPEEQLEARFDRIMRACVTFILTPGPRGPRADLVVIEGPAFGAKGNAVDQLAGLRLLLRHRLWRLDIPFAIVPPSTLKAYTTGHGRASKAEMVAALAERHGLDLKAYKVSHGKYDMADAYALAAMGYTRLGQPLLSRGGPPAPLKSLLAVDWPDVVAKTFPPTTA